MFCEQCGRQLPDGAKFCDGCGAKNAADQAGYQQPSAPVSSAPPSSYAAQGYASPQPAATYAPPSYNAPSYNAPTEPLSVGQYIGMFLLMCIPIANIVLLFVWSFGHSANLNKRNYARAALILSGVMLVFWLIAGGAVLAAFGGMMGSYY
ncbi:MAG: zinc ribbon domain-containing protein [Candidatus Pelethousia sp.]|nr:zinc ribbon domain-containing protein [Candidatus Pelethousia sp.]